MTAPIIDRITVEPEELAPGETATVTIEAHDPDVGSPARTLRIQGVVTDDKGQKAKGEAVIMIKPVPGDTITSYELINLDGAGFTIEQDASSPHIFRVTAP